MSTLIVGFFKNSKSYYAAIWQHIKHWKDAKQAIGVRFQKYEVPVYHRGVVVLRETRFRAIATFINHEGQVISRQCSSKGWPLYQVEETAPHTKYFRVIGLEGSKSSKASDYFTCLEGCNCPAYRHKSGLINGFCKHQLMLADEIGLNEPEEEIETLPEPEIESNLTPQEIEDGIWWPYNYAPPSPAKNEDEVDLNKLAKASINFGAVKPKPPQVRKSPPGTLRVVERGDLYGFYNITTRQFEEFNVFWEDIYSKALFYERKGHQIEGLFNNQYWIFTGNEGWIEFKQWKREVQEAREMLGV
jgi:hypothetical protein